jgi:Na+-translocating ferredoxin:NAD+ oxidoreductase RnfC subunit
MSGGLLRKDVTIINGGPMTGNIASKFDVVKKNTNGILILPNDNQVVLKRKANTQISAMRAKSTCCQCHSCTDLCPRYLLGHPIKPSEFMKAVSSGVTNDVPAILDTMYCVSCGICEMYACPQGLNPRSLIATFKDNMRKQGVKITPVENPEPVNPSREYRKVPMYRLKERLGLTKYDVDAPITDKEVKPKKLKIMLSQHIGAPAKSVVNKGTEIIAGDLIGKEIDNALSIPVFSPLSGTVAEANDEFVIIDVKGE